jgi:hypothetical protein
LSASLHNAVSFVAWTGQEQGAVSVIDFSVFKINRFEVIEVGKCCG